MNKNVNHVTRADVKLEGRKAFEDGKPRGYNPYIKINLEFASIWWNGWDAAQVERKTRGNGSLEITHTQREHAYLEGELAFEEGKPRVVNPYTASSPILEQVWMNGWDHGRRIKKTERSVLDDGTQPTGRL
jgi:ribosome modulation factor